MTLFNVEDNTSGKIITLERVYETIMFRSSKHVLTSRFLPDGTLLFINSVVKDFLTCDIGDNFIEALTVDEQKKVRRHLKGYTVDAPVKSHIQQTGGLKIRWINRAIFDDEGKIVEFEGIGWIIKSEKEPAMSGMII
jgi:hypothetical protein